MSRKSGGKIGNKIASRKFRKVLGTSTGLEAEELSRLNIERYNREGGVYQTRFIKEFDKLSEDMVDLRKTYATNLVAEYHNIVPKFLSLDLKVTKPSTAHQFETYNIRRGKRNVGKVSVMITRKLNNIEMVVVYQERVSSAKATAKTRQYTTYANKGQSSTRTAKRKSRNTGKDMR